MEETKMDKEKKVLISMKNIVKTFPGVVALDNASLTLHEGEIHALMGEMAQESLRS